MMQRNMPRLTYLNLPRQILPRNIRSMATPARPNPNPGNFANRPRHEVQEIGRKGGKKGGRARGVGGFHNMDPEKQV